MAGLAGCGSGSTAGTEPEPRTSQPSTETPTSPPTATAVPAELTFDELRYPPTVIQGETFQVGVEIANAGSTATDTTVTLAISDATSSKSVELGPGGVERFTFEIEGNVPPATYPLTFRTSSSEAVSPGELQVVARGPLLDEFVGVDGPNFELDGEPFAFNGGNNDMLGRAPRWYVDRVFEGAASLDFRALRCWAYAGRCHIGSCAGEGLTILPQPDDLDGPVETLPPLNETVLKRLDYAVYKANETGVRLVLPLLSNTESHTGIGDFVKYSTTAEGHDDFYTDETCRAFFKEYVTAILTRENTITGREYRNDPGILMWELVNEPDLLDNEGATSIMQGWFEEMAPFVKSVDDNHLLSTGEIGFYEDDRPQSLSNKNDQGMDYIANHQPDAIDAATFHIYLNQNDFTRVEDGSPRWKTWVENLATDAREQLDKPVYAGEFAPGNSDGDYLVDRRDEDWKAQDERRAEKYRELYEVFAETGVNGALNWTFMIPFDFATDPVDDPDQWNASVSVYPDDPHTPAVMQEYSSALGSNG